MYEVFSGSKKISLSFEADPSWSPGAVDAWLCFLPAPSKKDAKWDEGLGFWDAALRKEVGAFVTRFDFKPKEGEVLSFDRGAASRVVLAVLPKRAEPFFFLELARKALEPLHASRPAKIGIDLRACPAHQESLACAVASAHLALRFEAKKYGEEKDEDASKKEMKLHFVTHAQTLDESGLREDLDVTAGTNLVRYLSGLAGNDLTPTAYVKLATDLAKAQGLKAEFYSLEKLAKLKAGAFLAVAAASDDRGAGILKLSYRASKAKKSVALVGKGITFDTGGIQIKGGEDMFGMNGDMGGSAVALALALLAAKRKWPWNVDAYLAIAENAVGPKAYRPNDIIHTLSGKTIEVVHSDAEGRMVLADTLHLAGKEAPDLILDFATLTGACVRAIGTNYSGAYTNRPEWYARIIETGKRSGERVWPFPEDPDYGRALKSDLADIKQCRLTGGSDHIEAGYFLRQFVPEKSAWLHVDLSAAEADEGLAHVPSKLTGFGVRFAHAFLQAEFAAKA